MLEFESDVVGNPADILAVGVWPGAALGLPGVLHVEDALGKESLEDQSIRNISFRILDQDVISFNFAHHRPRVSAV